MTEQQALSSKIVGRTEGEIVAGTLLVKLDRELVREANEEDFGANIKEIFDGITPKALVPAIPVKPKNIEVARKYGLDQWFKVVFDTESSPQAVAERIAGSPLVKSIQYSRYTTPLQTDKGKLFTPSPQTKGSSATSEYDPHFKYQWNLFNDGTLSDKAVAGADKAGTQQGGSDKQPSLKEQVCGEWHSTEIPTADTDIYISLTEDGKFELYQKAGDGDYRLYRGTWGLEGTLLSGKYNDGEDWAASYNVAVKDSELKLVSNNDAAETSTFEKCSIPEDVKDTPHIEVKGADTF